MGAAAAPEAPAVGTTGTGDTAPVAAAAVCTLTKEMTEGPYHLDGQLVRADIGEDKTGFPLQLTLTVVDDDTCAPLGDALVEIWHCDALGGYSGFVGNNGHDEPDNGTFLRGAVLSNAAGVARITTVYPGWYRGRCVHIHLKVHTDVTLTPTARSRAARSSTPASSSPHPDGPGQFADGRVRGVADGGGGVELTQDGTGPLPDRAGGGRCRSTGRGGGPTDRWTQTDQPRSGEYDRQPIEFIRFRPGTMSSRSPGYSSGEHG